jgi:hypothetical protein
MVLRFTPGRSWRRDNRDGRRRRAVATAAAALSLGAASQLTHAQWEDPPATLPASDGANSDEYGFSVGVAGDVAIVGAPYHDALGQDAGAAYICRSVSGVWQEEKKLLPPDGAASDQFGYAVAIAGDFAVVGAYSHAGHGAAYVYRFNGSTWSYHQTLEPSDLGNGDSFGWDLDVSGDIMLVGANLHDNYAGAVYVYRYNGSSWTQEQKITAPPSAANFFGSSVAVWEDVAVIGNNLNAINGPGSGAAYVFRDNGTAWVEEQMIFPADGASNQKFGIALAVFGDAIVAGAPGDDDNGAGSGSAYVFRFGGHTWSQEAKLLASDGLGGDQFGTAVSISGGLIGVGAPARAVYDPVWMPSYGASYIFRHAGGTWSQEAILLDPDGWLWDEAGKAVSVWGNTVLMGIHLADGAGVDSGMAIVFEGRDVAPECAADINGDGVVDVSDFLDLLAEWGEAESPADINGDGAVDVADFLDLLAEWGPCP